MASTLLKWDVEDYFGMHQNSAYFEEENLLQNTTLFGLFPNPANRQITLSLLSNLDIEEEAFVSIYNGLGQEIEKRKIILYNGFILDINLNEYTNGVYLIQVNSTINDNIFYVNKFIIQH
jgi:hypothetical protein